VFKRNNERATLQCTEASGVLRIEGRYIASRQSAYEEFKVYVVHRGQRRVKNLWSVQWTEAVSVMRNSMSLQCTESSGMLRIEDRYIAPRQ